MKKFVSCETTIDKTFKWQGHDVQVMGSITGWGTADIEPGSYNSAPEFEVETISDIDFDSISIKFYDENHREIDVPQELRDSAFDENYETIRECAEETLGNSYWNS